MRKLVLFTLTFIFCVSAIFQLVKSVAFAADPILFFSDLTSGPKTGWNQSSTKGCAVTIWGLNFGATRGTNHVTINGANLTADNDYAEWGGIGPARNLERITFWLNNNCNDGPGTISLTVNGETSNTLPFTVRRGNIYFVDPVNGNDSNNGQYDTDSGIYLIMGEGNGPWQRFCKAFPSTNNVINPGDITYFRGGDYTLGSTRDGRWLIYMRPALGDTGTSGNPLSLIGHPEDIAAGNWPVLRGIGAESGNTIIDQRYADQIYVDYLHFSKLYFNPAHNGGALSYEGRYGRFVGNKVENAVNDGLWQGAVHLFSPDEIKIYGNYFAHNCRDSYQDDIYITAFKGGNHLPTDVNGLDIGWNEFFDMKYLAPDSSTYNGPQCIGIKSQGSAPHGVAVRSPLIHDNYFHDGEGAAIILIDLVEDPKIYNNIFQNMQHFRPPNEGFGPVILRNRNTAGPPEVSLNVYFFNNTFYQDLPNTPFIIDTNNGNPILYSKNNIYYTTNGPYWDGWKTEMYFSNDIFFGSGPPPSGETITLVNVLNIDPLYVEPFKGNFHLEENSPAIDAGTSNVSSIVMKDYNGNPRPQGSGFDIGAYELAGERDFDPPAPPTGLKVVP